MECDDKKTLPEISWVCRALSSEGNVLLEKMISVAGKTLEECFEYYLKVKKEAETEQIIIK